MKKPADSRWPASSSSLWLLGRHALAEAAGAHVGPHLVHVVHALLAGARRAVRAPARRYLLVRGPERVLLLVVDQDLEGGVLVHQGFLSVTGSSSRACAAAGKPR